MKSIATYALFVMIFTGICTHSVAAQDDAMRQRIQQVANKPEVVGYGRTDAEFPETLINPPIITAKAKVQMRDWGNVRLSDASGFKKVIISCLDVRGYASLDPLQDVLAYLGYREDPKTRTWTPSFSLDRDVRLTVLQNPKHGIVGEGLQYGAGTYGYLITERNADGIPSYYGTDRIVYLVKFKGQKFKIVINVLSISAAETFGRQLCERRKFGLLDVPIGTTNKWFASAQLSMLLSEVSGVSLSLADLPSIDVAETTGHIRSVAVKGA
jgi:hypothetical protein